MPASAKLPTMRGAACLARQVALLAFAAVLADCGGGGGGGGGGPTPTFPPSSTLAALCAKPRTGNDPLTGVAYPDRQGTLLDELDWLASWTDDLYLWYSEVPYGDPASYSSTAGYFAVLKTPLSTASGKAKDQFHFTYTDQAWESLSQSGVQGGYGATWAIVHPKPPRMIVVAYTEPNSPATSASVALARGAQVLQVDGVDAVNAPSLTDVTTINNGLNPQTVGETHQFVVLDAGSTTPRTITMVSANVTSTPVQNVGTLAGGAVGYMLFNDHLATAELALINAINQLQAAQVTDLVIDIRYNGGGYLAVASELAYMVAGPAQTTGKTFELPQFNDKHPTVDPVTKLTITPYPFLPTAIGLSAPSFTPLPHLDLGRVYVLTGPTTCSASESVINSLNGIGVQVIQIGSTTCGKPYAFYPTDNCGTTYFSIQFQGVNAQGFGGYADGFVPQNGATAGIAAGAILPGCSVADDFTHNLGDPAEGRLAAALQYRASQTCPAATGIAAPGMVARLAATDGRVFKTPFLENRILRR